MRDEVQRVYSTLLTRVHRKPRTASTDEFPVLVGALDLPVYRRDRTSGPMVLCNGGLHVHALMMMSPTSRLKESLADHFQKNRDLYAGSGRSVQRIHVRPVVDDHERVVDYVLKTVLNGRLSYDEAVLVLPRSRGELESVRQLDHAAGSRSGLKSGDRNRKQASLAAKGRPGRKGEQGDLIIRAGRREITSPGCLLKSDPDHQQ